MARGRGVSTVVDVAVCLLLVGAAVATLAIAAAPSDDPGTVGAGATAATLATSTAGIPSDGGRTAHDTYVGHLADAALVSATVDERTGGTPHTEADTDADARTETAYPSAVREEVEDSTDERVFVTARWEPYPDAPLCGRVQAGDRPPETADVATTTVSVATGLESPETVDGFRPLAEAVSGAYVRWRLPPARTRTAWIDDRTADEAERRYLATAEAVGLDRPALVTDVTVEDRRERLVDALADRLEDDLRDRYPTPEAAIDDLTLEGVEIVVARWEPST